MPATFSINIGTTTEATRKPDVFSVLNDIQDNTQKLISPRDVRDAILSTWGNTPFKVTTPNSLSNYEYIGIDSSNPANRDIKQKILLGKRSYGGLDIMNNSLLNLSNSADIFIFNTKEDSVSQDSTKVAILAGTMSNLYLNAPYIESKVNSSKTGIDLNLTNKSANGAINLLSTSGRVSINGVIFPTVAETSASASNGMILRYRGTYPQGYFKWEEPTISLNTIGNINYPTNIYGSTVSVNGYPIEFIDSNLVSATMGGVPMGFSFSGNSFLNPISGTHQNWPLTEVLRKVLYPYVAPVLSLSIDSIPLNNVNGNLYAEVGTIPLITLTYSITTYARNETERICSYKVTNTNITGLSFSGKPGTIKTGNIVTSTFSSSVATKNWVLNVSDSGLPNSFSYSATASIQFIKPIYYGFTSSIITSEIQLTSLSKSITPYPGTGLSQSIIVNYKGEGYLYFATSTFPTLIKQIQDPNGYIIYDSDYPSFSSFTFSSIGTYLVCRTNNQCGYPGLNNTTKPGGNFKFIF